jgi:hypothetical protein
MTAGHCSTAASAFSTALRGVLEASTTINT